MGLFDWLKGRKNGSTEQQAVNFANIESVNGQSKELSKSNGSAGIIQFRSYEHGLVNGVLNVSEKPFMDFTDEFFKQAQVEDEIARTDKEIEILSSEIQVGKIASIERNEKILLEKKSVQRFRIRREYLERVLQKLEDRLKQSKEHLLRIKEQFVSDYTLLPALLFFVAGVLFIVADYGLALTIIGDALKIGIETTEVDGELKALPTPTTYLFAAAIAALSFAIKPAYDRIIEKKYPESRAVKRFNWSIIIVGLLVLFMLFAMGMFREVVIGEGLRTQMNSEQIETTNSPGSTDIFAAVDTAPNSEVARAESNDSGDEKNPLIHNIWALISIVLSTCLFALTGAICMGIAIPVLYKNGRIFFNYLMQFNYRRRIFVLNHQLRPVSIQFETIQLEIQHQSHILEDILTYKEKIPQLTSLKEKSIQLRKDYFKIRTVRSNSIYTDGYERGKALKDQLPDEWAKEQILINPDVNEDGSTYNNISAGAGSEHTEENGELTRTRPFVAVRKMISGRFRRKFFDGPESNMEIK